MPNAFGGIRYSTQVAMLEGIAQTWLESHGADTDDDAQRAEECTRDFGLATAQGIDEPSHMDAEGYGIRDLHAAFVRVRALPRVTPPHAALEPDERWPDAISRLVAASQRKAFR